MKIQKESSKINYHTQWKHDYLKPDQYLYFEPNTPVEIIVSQLENHLNQLYPDFKTNYKTPTIYSGFSQLYRNLKPYYKKWQVLYRKVGSQEDYHPIVEQIGYKARGRQKLFFNRNVLTNAMRWTHDLDLLVNNVEIKGANNCETIAQRLNEKILESRAKTFRENLQPYFDSLTTSYKELDKDLLNSDYQNNDRCQKFLTNYKHLYNYCEQIRVLMTKDYRVHAFNVNDVLQKNKTNKSAKGWRVEFIN